MANTVTAYPVVLDNYTTLNSGNYLRAVPENFKDAFEPHIREKERSSLSGSNLDEVYRKQFPTPIPTGNFCYTDKPLYIQTTTRQNSEGKYRTEIRVRSEGHIRQFGNAVEDKFNELSSESGIDIEEKAWKLAEFMVSNLPQEHQGSVAPYANHFIQQIAPRKNCLAYAFTNQGKYRANHDRDTSASYALFIDHDKPLQWKLPRVTEFSDNSTPASPEVRAEYTKLRDYVREQVAPLFTACWIGDGTLRYTQPIEIDLSPWVEIEQEKTVAKSAPLNSISTPISTPPDSQTQRMATVQFREHMFTSTRSQRGYFTVTGLKGFDPKFVTALEYNGFYPNSGALPCNEKELEGTGKTYPIAFSHRILDGHHVFCHGVYLGRDRHSRSARFGNYLAHSLITQTTKTSPPLYVWPLLEKMEWKKGLTDEEDSELGGDVSKREVPVRELDLTPDTQRYLEETRAFLAEDPTRVEKLKEIIASTIEGKRTAIVDDPNNLLMYTKIFSLAFHPYLVETLEFSSYHNNPQHKGKLQFFGLTKEDDLSILKDEPDVTVISGRAMQNAYANAMIDIFQNGDAHQYDTFTKQFAKCKTVQDLKTFTKSSGMGATVSPPVPPSSPPLKPQPAAKPDTLATSSPPASDTKASSQQDTDEKPNNTLPIAGLVGATALIGGGIYSATQDNKKQETKPDEKAPKCSGISFTTGALITLGVALGAWAFYALSKNKQQVNAR